MATVTGFPPIENRNARILILGSMPSVKSLEQHQYYAHPRNNFWPIIEKLFSSKSGLSYKERTELLLSNNIALWDVLKCCYRPGSLDTSIDDDSIITNDFSRFFREHPLITTVYFNGARAEQEFNKRVKPTLDPAYAELCYTRLPSTSPAMASLTPAQKLEAWSIIKD